MSEPQPADTLADVDHLTRRDKRRFAVIDFDGRPLRIQSLTERERSRYEAAFLDGAGKLSGPKLRRAKVLLLVMTAVDAEGNLILQEKHIEALMDRDASVINETFDAIAEHVGIKKRDLEGLKKNYGLTADDDSPST